MAIEPLSAVPQLEDEWSRDDRIETMVGWFFENFEDPANSLPYESAEGGYQWIWGGPYDAREELQDAFPEATEKEIEAAVDRVEHNGTLEWTPAGHRITNDDDYELVDPLGIAEYDGFKERHLPSVDDPHRYTIVETVLFPRRNFGWSIHASFVPVRTNQTMSEVVYAATGAGAYGRDDYTFSSLRDLIATLVGRQLVGVPAGQSADDESAYKWIKSLKKDSEVFVDDGMVVHSSPPEWLQLRDLFKHGSIGGVALISQSPGNLTGVLLMYGGSLIFLRLVRNLNFVQDAFFERWAKRIRKGDNDPF